MRNRKLSTTAILGSAVALALGGLATGTATAEESALQPTQVSVGGDTSIGDVPVTGSNENVISIMTDGGAELRCADSDIAGTLFRGTDVIEPEVIGEIEDLTFTNCTATDLNFPVTVTASAGEFEVVEGPYAPGEPVRVDITGFEAHMVQTSAATGPCEAWATGDVAATVYPGDHPDNPAPGSDGGVELVPAEFDGPFPVDGFDLDVVAGNGSGTPVTSSCGGMVWTGDSAGPWYDDNDNEEDPSVFGLDTDGAGVVSHQ